MVYIILFVSLIAILILYFVPLVFQITCFQDVSLSVAYLYFLPHTEQVGSCDNAADLCPGDPCFQSRLVHWPS
jgi:hypothetical protein